MKKVSIGGQALIEGIMMKSPEKTAIAVREPSGNISVEYVKEKHIKDKFSFFGLPIIRGVVTFIESMILGYKALMISADKSGLTELEEEEEKRKKEEKLAKKKAKAIAKGKPEPVKKDNKKKTDIIISVVMVVGMILGVALAVFLFMWAPTALFNGLKLLLGGNLSETVRPFFEGILKIAIFIGYVAVVSLTKDIKRVFMYHGAEHKTIFCLENGLELNIENAKSQSRFHPRCGTSFMILMLIVGILINLIIVTLFPCVTNLSIIWVLIKILMVPFICGIGYELIKICGRYDNPLTRAISAPGMWVQRLTTKEPDDDMLEVAIVSIKAVLPQELRKAEQDCSFEN